MRSKATSAALAGLVAVAVALAVRDGGAGASDTAAPPTARRDAIAQTARVAGAPGRELVLSRVVVPPGAHLALHHHRGSQVARVESGVLTYTVRRGAVTVRRGQSDAHPIVVRRIRAGQTGRIRARQWLVEQPSDVHEARNSGDRPVVITIATLLATGAPPATPVTLPR